MQQERQSGAKSPLRCFEFYSGIGGMHCALAAAFPNATVTHAFDISPAANDAYEFVFGRRPWQVMSRNQHRVAQSQHARRCDRRGLQLMHSD
jgi:site-specific DNA-cytosine methylase